jgi:hypothetical protein
MYSGQNSTDHYLGLNSLIMVVLIARSIVDYYVGWESFYNKLPQKRPEEILRLSSYLVDKGKMTPVYHDSIVFVRMGRESISL